MPIAGTARAAGPRPSARSAQRVAAASLVRVVLLAVAVCGGAPAPAAPPATAVPDAARGALAPPPPLDTAPYAFRTVEGAGGVPLNVVTVGDPRNPPILFVHGLGQSYLSFERQFRSELASRFFLVGFDLRGHGNSGKPSERAAYAERAVWGEDVDRVVKATGIRRPVIVGWSYGTMVAIDWLRYAGPEAAAGVVFVGAYGGLTPPPDMSGAALPPSMVLNRQRQFAPDLEQNYVAARNVARLLTAEPMPDDWTNRAVAIAMMLPRVAREGMFMRSLDSRDLLPRLAGLPFLIDVGSRDVSTPEATARELARQLGSATVSVYDGNGHSPFVESPERFNRELAAFAARTLEARGGH